jgi:endo-1,3-1,4-beta-glycanase ExoK
MGNAVCLALTLSPVAACGAPPAKPKPAGMASFFEPFDRLDPKRWYISDGWVNGAHQACTWSRDNVSAAGGTLRLILRRAPDKLRSHRCAELRTHEATGYGTYEVRLRSAAGSGLNTAMFTYSGPPMTPVHDEIDFEFLGKDTGKVQLNFFTSARGGHERMIPVGADAAGGFNTYAFEWAPGRVRWFVNGTLVRTEEGAAMPRVPGQFFLSLWAGAPPVDGWLGRFDPAAGPAVAEVDWVAFTRAGERCLFPQSITCR